MRGARFDPYGLPDAACRGVPAPLFSDGLFGIIHRIFDADHKRGMKFAVVAGLERVSDVEFVRKITAFAMTQMNAVHPNVGEKIGGANGEDRSLALPLFVARDRYFAAIPAN